MNTKMYIGGQLVAGEGSLVRVENPADGSIIESFQGASAEQAEQALQAARKAFATWSKTSVDERIEWMLKFQAELYKDKDFLVELDSMETGKPFKNAVGDFEASARLLTFYGDEARRVFGTSIPDKSAKDHGVYHVVEHRPRGVVVGHLAWNYPLANMGLKMGPALASGCTIVLKPSSQTCLASLHYGEIAKRIGLPDGVINIVAGKASEVGRALNSSKIPNMITLIGSSDTGVQVMNEGSTSIKNYSLELGGNAPVIIMGDCGEELESIAMNIVATKVSNSGQDCTDYNRIYVHESLYERFCKLVEDKMNLVTVGRWKDEGQIVMGPMINRQARDRILELIDDAVSGGAKLVKGGVIPEGMENGNFVTPALLVDVKDSMRCAREEIFGPIIAVQPYSDFDRVLEQAVDTDMGLASYLWGHDARAIAKAFETFESGDVFINGASGNTFTPHVGVKQSGLGCDQSKWSLNEYYTLKRISMKP